MKTYYLAAAVCLTLVGCSSTSNITETLIQPDPAWTSGQLENGLTYHVYPDHEESVSVRLVVHAGSFQETDQQEGYAHFLEHMAFNGSKNFSQNDVIRLFEDAGASFGADINAYTSYQETVYQLDLPDNVQLQSALTWMRDIGDGLDLSSSEVEKEKGVILGEFRYARLDDKPFAEQFFDHFIEGGQYEGQDALGTKESVLNVTSQGLNSFYQTWYQPQIVEVIVSGDIDTKIAIPLIEEKFSDWQRGKTPKPEKQRITNFNDGDYIEYAEGETPSISLMINRGSSEIETREQQHQLWLDETAQQLIRQRLNTKFNDAALATQWVVAEHYSMEYQRYSSISVGYPVGAREVTQQELIATLASLRDYGVSENEIISEQHYYQDLLDNVEIDWDNMDSVQHANQKAMALVNEQVVQSQRDYEASLEEFVANLDLDVINANIKALLSSDYFVVVGMNESEDKVAITQAIESLKATYSEKGAKPLFSVTSSAFAVPSSQGDIELVEQMYVDPYVQKWTLSNGIDMWYLRDSLAGGDIGIYYTSLGGKAALDPSLYPATELALAAVGRSGVGSFTGTELDAHLDREDIQVYPFIDSTRHGVEFKLNNSGLAETFAALNAIVTSVKVSPEQLEAVKQEFIQNRDSYLASPTGQFAYAMNQNTYQADSDHVLLDSKSVETVSVEEIKSVHQQLFGQFRDNQLVIVGDIDPSELKPLVRQYLASIPLEKADVPDFNVAYKHPSKARIDLAVNTTNSTEYMLRVIAEPSAHTGMVRGQTAKDVFMEDMLQRVLATRLDAYIREDLSLDYSPYAYYASQDGETSHDWFIGAMIDPKNADQIEVAIDKVVADLLKGVSQDEVRVAGKQLEADFTPLDTIVVDQAWFVSRYLLHDYGVEALFNVKATVNSISREDMNQLVQRIFGENSRKVKNIMRPKA
ncbi:M16 family metallopeptidase [Vibrio sp. 10N.261.46.E12]|uniref:M16 family metallopeptidase n=1 Tax=unclassified Vibrio TaxID=2614977 RepID=UPI000976EBC6|nr:MULTISPECIES: M16 family metallopeptidase [unclassified Vibrio]OMO35997.1 peptidase M16 [Vibrio sp. 10N.261.45.E1]PMJ19939.1 peptidase M16 [Vibrio sp. 10N.286.45.B6]PML85332.1 peptidase M16 [Vibrio sp. 10N.261.49.E11]PMM72656.1 peptidase M16 [Vibrio sp. 10N.261.46.F12]PMM84124.1 peptidase M16 [Vibrio sp. 10N.261.46.E8]